MKGGWGWLGLTIYIILWDFFATDTLSSAFYRAVSHPIQRWFVITIWAVITLHLFKLIPKRFDLIWLIVQGLKYLKGG
jgi:hypothetical protein